MFTEALFNPSAFFACILKNVKDAGLFTGKPVSVTLEREYDDLALARHLNIHVDAVSFDAAFNKGKTIRFCVGRVGKFANVEDIHVIEAKVLHTAQHLATQLNVPLNDLYTIGDRDDSRFLTA